MAKRIRERDSIEEASEGDSVETESKKLKVTLLARIRAMDDDFEFLVSDHLLHELEDRGNAKLGVYTAKEGGDQKVSVVNVPPRGSASDDRLSFCPINHPRGV